MPLFELDEPDSRYDHDQLEIPVDDNKFKIISYGKIRRPTSTIGDPLYIVPITQANLSQNDWYAEDHVQEYRTNLQVNDARSFFDSYAIPQGADALGFAYIRNTRLDSFSNVTAEWMLGIVSKTAVNNTLRWTTIRSDVRQFDTTIHGTNIVGIMAQEYWNTHELVNEVVQNSITLRTGESNRGFSFIRPPEIDGRRIKFALQTPPSDGSLLYSIMQIQEPDRNGSWALPRTLINRIDGYNQFLWVDPDKVLANKYRIRVCHLYSLGTETCSRWYLHNANSGTFIVDPDNQDPDDDFTVGDPTAITVFDQVALTIPDIDEGRCS